MVGVLARSPRAAAASRGGSARPAWLGVAFILMRGLFWGGGGCPDTELRLLADKVMGGAVRGSTSMRTYKYTNDSFSTSIELRLALSYPGMLSDAPCRRCGCGKIIDVNGYHVLMCMPSAVRERIYWHDRIRDEVASFCRAMGLRGVKTEQLVDDASQSRNDVQVEVWNPHGGPLWLDVVTTMPMQASTLASATTIPGVAARKAEVEKITKYRGLPESSSPPATFIPLALEFGGTWGDAALVFFREAVKRAGGSHSDQSSRLAYWMRRFSVVGRRAVTVALARCVRRLRGGAPAVGDDDLYAHLYDEQDVVATSPPPPPPVFSGGVAMVATSPPPPPPIFSGGVATSPPPPTPLPHLLG